MRTREARPSPDSATAEHQLPGTPGPLPAREGDPDPPVAPARRCSPRVCRARSGCERPWHWVWRSSESPRSLALGLMTRDSRDPLRKRLASASLYAVPRADSPVRLVNPGRDAGSVTAQETSSVRPLGSSSAPQRLAQRATQRDVSRVRITMITSGALPGPSSSNTSRLLPARPRRSTHATCPLGGLPSARQGRSLT